MRADPTSPMRLDVRAAQRLQDAHAVDRARGSADADDEAARRHDGVPLQGIASGRNLLSAVTSLRCSGLLMAPFSR